MTDLNLPSETPSPAQRYSDRITTLQELVSGLKSKENFYSRSRGACFLTSILFVIVGVNVDSGAWFWYLLATVLFVLFVAAVGIFEHIEQSRKTEQLRMELQEQQQARLRREWDRIPAPNINVPDRHKPTAIDLDLFSIGGLYHFLSRAHTHDGKNLLRDWILETPTSEEIEERQSAVTWLRTQHAFRDQFELHGRMLASSQGGPDALIEWGEGPTWFRQRAGLKWFLRILACMIPVLLALILARVVPVTWFLGIFGLIVFSVLMNSLLAGTVHDLFNKITAGKNELVHYGALFQMVDELPKDVPRLNALQEKLKTDGYEFRGALAELRRIMQLANGRRSALYFVPYLFLQLMFYWDFHILEWLETWQLKYGKSIRKWFESVAELEALNSLATVSADHPEWIMPSVTAGAESIKATQLGHPLISPDDCCRNDVELGPPGTFLLVTGSNMSGKSTLLRSLGVNALLAQAGGPVCANSLSMPTIELATSMRVTDSLNDGVSFFFAELTRLKSIVDHAQSVDTSAGIRQLFLLDEILQGTNSAERHIAVARVIKHLVGHPTLGAVSTHDLELADSEELKKCCQTVHFREQFVTEEGKRKMTFDYQLREGVSPTTNALKLLEMVGLSESED
jgi:ABC-type multidrug transport system fused ATPase/permease subunit